MPQILWHNLGKGRIWDLESGSQASSWRLTARKSTKYRCEVNTNNSVKHTESFQKPYNYAIIHFSLPKKISSNQPLTMAKE
jgi:hypothetical protein